jgi:hypothetical protein
MEVDIKFTVNVPYLINEFVRIQDLIQTFDMASAVLFNEGDFGTIEIDALEIDDAGKETEKAEIDYCFFAFNETHVVIKITGYRDIEIGYDKIAAIVNIQVFKFNGLVEVAFKIFGYDFPEHPFRICGSE